MRIERLDRPITAPRLAAVTRRLLGAAPLCAIATVRGREAYVNTAYFAWSGTYEIVWISSPDAQHSRNLRASGSCALAIFDTRQTWGGTDRGIQLFGRARPARGAGAAAAKRLYGRRFRDYDAEQNADYPPYVFTPARVKLFHEREFGPATWVTASVRDGRLAWQRTERYADDTA